MFEPAAPWSAPLGDPRRLAGECSPSVATSAQGRALLHRLEGALRAGGLEVVLTADRFEEMLIELEGMHPDAVVCALPTQRVLSCVQFLHDRFPAVHIVIVTPSSPRLRLRRLFDAGAGGLVFEPNVETVLATAVRAVCGGQISVPAECSGSIERPPLTHRQRQVLRLMTLGKGNAEIGRCLYLSESTVKGHLSAAFARLGVRSRAEAAALIFDPDAGRGLGVLEPDRYTPADPPKGVETVRSGT
jgi:DNA-binding NarL/FixJ family response regulator